MTDLVSRAWIGFGFLYNASPGAAALRGGKRAADHSHRAHSAAPGAAPGRRTEHFAGPNLQREAARYNGVLGRPRVTERASCAVRCRRTRVLHEKRACPKTTHP